MDAANFVQILNEIVCNPTILLRPVLVSKTASGLFDFDTATRRKILNSNLLNSA